MHYWVVSNISATIVLWKIGEEYIRAKGRVQVEQWNKIKFELLGVYINSNV